MNLLPALGCALLLATAFGSCGHRMQPRDVATVKVITAAPGPVEVWLAQGDMTWKVGRVYPGEEACLPLRFEGPARFGLRHHSGRIVWSTAGLDLNMYRSWFLAVTRPNLEPYDLLAMVPYHRCWRGDSLVV